MRRPQPTPNVETRRRFLAHAALLGVAPFHIVKNRPPVKLRVLGTNTTIHPEIKKRAETDLGIELSFEAAGSSAVLQRGTTRPKTFDVLQQGSNSIRLFWRAKSIKGLDSKRLKNWPAVTRLAKKGTLEEGVKPAPGDVPNEILYVQKDGSIGPRETETISYVPFVHNVDSFGYDDAALGSGEPHVAETWASLLDPQFKGKVGICNATTIGLFDLALAARSRGLAKFVDISNPTRGELDTLFDALIPMKSDGFFAGFWNDVRQSADFFRSGRAVIQSMFSPTAATLRGEGMHVHNAVPKEGYRAWFGVMCLSRHISEEVEDAAYRYFDWWLSGWPGAWAARQGYYISTPENSRRWLDDDEWGYWYEGEPAKKRLRNSEGRYAVEVGERRCGGSYEQRFRNIAVWGRSIDAYEYSLQRWYELLTS